MNRKVPNIAYTLFKYGVFSKPFLNYILEEKIDRTWKHYFKAQKSKWKRDYNSALKEIEAGLKSCKRNLTLFYLLYAEKILYLKNLNNPEGDKLFKDLRKNYDKVPSLARKIIAPTLFDYFVHKYEDLNFQKIRFWSKQYQLDKSSYLFLLLAKARMEIKKNLRLGVSLFSECFKIAKKIPHPTGILLSLNNSAWYLKEKHQKFSLKLINKAFYFAGWYREDINSIFFLLDTLLEVQKINNDLSIFETTNIINIIEKNLPKGSGWGTREYYKNTINFAKKYTINLKIKSYKNTEELREFLLKFIKTKKIIYLSKILDITPCNLSLFLRGRTITIKDKTIKKFIENLNIPINIFETPLPYLTEYIKKKIEEEFEKNIEKFLKLSDEEKILLFISTYMGILRGKNFYLSRKNRLKKFFKILLENPINFINLFIKDHELLKYFNNIMNLQCPLYLARRDLALDFLKNLSKIRRREFIEFYVNLKEEERKLIDIFVRNYVRYNRRWEVNLPSINELEDFIKKYHLKKNPTVLSIYYFDSKFQRKKVISLLKKF